MNRLVRRRPPAIHAFAVLFAAQALIAFAAAITDLPRTQALYAATFPALAVDRDFAIIATSARASIALIPVALVWWRGARFARWLVPAMVTLRLVLARPDMPAVEWLTLVLALAAAALLFTPGARRWFAGRRSADDRRGWR